MLDSPRYEVILWHRVVSSPPDLHERIIARAGRPPDEKYEMQGFQDLHWNFDSAEEATMFAESFFEVAGSNDVTLLVISAIRDEAFRRKVYKDTRSSIKCSA